MARIIRTLLVAAALVPLAGPIARAQDSGGAPGASPGGDAPTKSGTGNEDKGTSRGGQVGGGLGAGGTGPGRNTNTPPDASSGTR